MRYKYNLVCEHCTYETQYHAWMVMHTERCHKAGHSGDPAAGAVAQSSGSGAAAAGRSRPANPAADAPPGGRTSTRAAILVREWRVKRANERT